MKYILALSALLFTALLIWVTVELSSLPFFLGMVVGFVLTVFFSIFALKYIEIEEKRKKLANVKPIYQNDYRKPDPGNPIHEGSDTIRGEQENHQDENREQPISTSSGTIDN